MSEDTNKLPLKKVATEFVLVLLRSTRSTFYYAVCLVSLWVLFQPAETFSYVLAPEQILDLMAKNFAAFRRVAVTQTVHIPKSGIEGRELSFKETIYLKTPGFYARTADSGGISMDLPYRIILMPGSVSYLADYLFRLGINSGERCLSRQDGVISYRLGDKDKQSSALFVEKERVIPILFRTRIQSATAHGFRVVSFKDYRQVDEDWYPHELEISEYGATVVRFMITEIKVDPVIPGGIVFNPIEIPPAAHGAPSPLQETIRALTEANK
ncbi:MAG: hypothetical protein C4582_01885 [Desulfobacteraceae bacterium]|jgi:hypothetical protein|nr:MAG: hypothetical protein C4582_01885 [Desulfobacteraceae bacterium]